MSTSERSLEGVTNILASRIGYYRLRTGLSRHCRYCYHHYLQVGHTSCGDQADQQGPIMLLVFSS
jgi:hypothetical protein